MRLPCGGDRRRNAEARAFEEPVAAGTAVDAGRSARGTRAGGGLAWRRVHERVLIGMEASAGQVLGRTLAPVDAAVVGIIDTVDLA